MGLGSLAMLAFWGALIVGTDWLVRDLGADAADPANVLAERRYTLGATADPQGEDGDA